MYLVVLVAGRAMKIFDAGEGQEGEFEQGFAVSCERQRLPRMPVCISENNTLSKIVESAGGCTHAWQGRRSTSKMEGVIRKVNGEVTGGLVSIPAAAQAAAVDSSHCTGKDIVSRSHAMLAARATTAKAIRDT